MTGSVHIIDLPGPVTAEQLAELRAAFRSLAERCEEARVGSYDLDIDPAALDARDPERQHEDADGGGAVRRFTVSIAGPGFGDEAVFRTEHADDPDLDALIGFTPTHDVAIATTGRDFVDRLMIARLTAIVQDVVDGLVDVNIPTRVLDQVRGLPGVVAVLDEGWPRVFGTAEFLRAWTAHPEFRWYALGIVRLPSDA
ncbi:DUF6368 family protein [Catenulispora rubra]|uniref:DUF6368 family protein n=1 Tax=Catenulispora rubra TaxID=280293 RepID=UPI0018925233|nr:DUF6368 family protein [Catenulispora rubra]